MAADLEIELKRLQDRGWSFNDALDFVNEVQRQRNVIAHQQKERTCTSSAWKSRMLNG